MCRSIHTTSNAELEQGFGQNTVPTDPVLPIASLPASEDVNTEEAPPPVYSELYGSIDISQNGLNTHASLASKRESRIWFLGHELMRSKMMGGWKFASTKSRTSFLASYRLLHKPR